MLDDREDWIAEEHECPQCGWNGCGIALAEHAVTADVIEMRCPSCEQCIAFALTPEAVG